MLYDIAASMHIDALFRFINRKKLLVVMYHGVTNKKYDPPVWTQLPAEIFINQMAFLKDSYRLVSLAEVIGAIKGEISLPERAALVTFDDGLKNNYTVAFPILQSMRIPSTIFLTVNFIGTQEILWFDELYLIISGAMNIGRSITLPDGSVVSGSGPDKIWPVYVIFVEALKRVGPEIRSRWLFDLNNKYPILREEWLDDFGLLNWDEVLEMHHSGLVDFGVHTATHRILTELDTTSFEDEIASPKNTLENHLGQVTTSFCYPNGRPALDFDEEHIEYLKNTGFNCAFATCNKLFSPGNDNPFIIGRVPAGHDASSFPTRFRLNTSGLLQFTKSTMSKLKTF